MAAPTWNELLDESGWGPSEAPVDDCSEVWGQPSGAVNWGTSSYSPPRMIPWPTEEQMQAAVAAAAEQVPPATVVCAHPPLPHAAAIRLLCEDPQPGDRAPWLLPSLVIRINAPAVTMDDGMVLETVTISFPYTISVVNDWLDGCPIDVNLQAVPDDHRLCFEQLTAVLRYIAGEGQPLEDRRIEEDWGDFIECAVDICEDPDVLDDHRLWRLLRKSTEFLPTWAFRYPEGVPTPPTPGGIGPSWDDVTCLSVDGEVDRLTGVIEDIYL